MKALTLMQPWATLVAIGAKRIETRSWNTHYRGTLAIHAAKGFPKDARQLVGDWQFFAALNPVHAVSLRAAGVRLVPSEVQHRETRALPIGCVLATCRLAACVSTDRAWRPRDAELLTDTERAFGDYSPGRFAWILEDVKVFPEPIPSKGPLGLWNWTEYPGECASDLGIPGEPCTCALESSSICPKHGPVRSRQHAG